MDSHLDRAMESTPEGILRATLARRRFLGMSLAGGALAAAGGLPGIACAQATRRPRGRAEELAEALYASLADWQRPNLCFPYDHRQRTFIGNFWFVVNEMLAQTLNPDQRALAFEIFKALHSDEYGPTVHKQVLRDGTGDFNTSTSLAFFGTPESGRFQMVMTAHHMTRRTHGEPGIAFGGPIFYGHLGERFFERPDHPGNAYWFQAKRANAVYQMLDGRQRGLALVDGDRRDRGTETVRLAGRGAKLPGIPMSELARDQQAEVRKVLGDLVRPFREEDAASVLRFVDGARFDELHLAFYKARDLGGDGVWDVWQLESPSMIWFFNGAPHVHVWAHVREAIA